VRRRRQRGDPLADFPAELSEFDAKEWAAPGEDPSEADWSSQHGDPVRSSDWYRCRQRYSAALHAWFDGHPDADFLTWIQARRERRRARLGAS
jgi:hypothetical protein